jgi:tRNA dimethylallyltransferase
MNSPKTLIITGPTASGKTQLSELIAEQYPCEIINADVGQFYTPLSVGTAKPDLDKAPYKHHLFNILDKPEDLSVSKYRNLVIDCIRDITKRGKIPIIVGGSLFYIKSLFFPPTPFELQKTSPSTEINLEKLDKHELWKLLQKIDPERAEQLHPNDTYRINRALKIWLQTGQKPSTLKPEFKAEFNALIVYIQPNPEELKKRIKQRTIKMINDGWIQEVEQIMETNWEPFLMSKGIIGYPEILNWIKTGKNKNQLPELIEKIQTQTLQYAKRQRIFWKKFEQEAVIGDLSRRSLGEVGAKTESREQPVKTMTINSPDKKSANQIMEKWENLADL